jgi:hypothetical protein
MIKNTVTSRAIVSIDLADFYPTESDCEYIDLKDYLFKGLILKEADFRTVIDNMDWERFRSKQVGLFCSADAIVPMWAYMVFATSLAGIAKMVLFGKKSDFPLAFLHEAIRNISIDKYQDKRLVIKGCGDKTIDEQAFTLISFQLALVAKAISYGEPCSTVPVYKRID